MREDDIIQRFFAPLAGPDGYALKDDAACIAASPADGDIVVTSDMILPGVHFLTGDAPENIAWKALAVNVSDLVAKGATPLGYTLSLGLPHKCDDSFLKAFALGLKDAQTAFGCHLVGGDTTRVAKGQLGPVVSVTAFGRAKAWVQRTTAKPDAALYVTAPIGDAALGLMLSTGEQLSGLDDAGIAHLKAAYVRPTPRSDAAFVSLVHSHAIAAMDVSDGLVKDAGRMAHASDVAITIKAHQVPLSKAARTVVSEAPDMLKALLTGGDDYCVLCCIPNASRAGYEREAAQIGIPSQPIGHVEAGAGVRVLDANGNAMTFQSTGYDHG